MFLDIVTTVTLIASCFGHAPAYDERASNEAISTQSFNRDDIPISYKYTAIHVYSTQKPIDQDDVIHPQRNKKSQYHVVQYAPLVKNTTKKPTPYMKIVIDPNNITKQASNIENDKLEPRKQSSSIGDSKLRYFVSGHNIEVKRSPNGNLGYNAIYENNSENLKGTNNKITYSLRNSGKHQKSGNKNEPIKSFRAFEELKQEPFAWMFEQKQKPEMIYKGETNKQTYEMNPVSAHHTHRMRVNVARLNGHAQVIAREIVIGDMQKNSVKPQKQSNRKGSLRLNGEQRTLLYPLHRQKHF